MEAVKMQVLTMTDLSVAADDLRRRGYFLFPYRLTFCSLKHSLHLDVI